MVVSGCATPSISSGTIEGQLNHLARIALPPGTQAVVELRDDGRDQVVSEQRQVLLDRQLPMAFSLRVEPGQTQGPGPFSVHAALLRDGQPLWISQAVRVDLRKLPIDLGELRLSAAPPPLSFASTLNCADRTFSFGRDGDRPMLQAGTQRLPMQPVRTASGSRYVVPDDADTWVWFKGDRATVMIRGEVLPECVVVASAEQSPAMRLQGPAWTVQRINGEPVLDDAHPTLAFGEDGQLTGNASCNSYNARYTLTQSAIEITRTVSTMRSCAPALMAQETRFFQLLQGAQRVTLHGDGLLTLHAGPDRSLQARR